MLKFLRRRPLISAFLLVVICWGIFLCWNNTALKVTEYSIAAANIPSPFDGFRIVQISDLHNAEFGKENCRLLEKIRALTPDMIVITGDIVHKSPMDNALAFARQAVSIAPTYYVPGNHELGMDFETLYQSLRDVGVINLLNESLLLTRDSAQINLIGLQDPAATPNVSVTKVLQPLINENTYNILLAHRPERIDSYVFCGADLVLSGHTHGGQVHLPYIGALYATGQGFLPKYDVGLFTVDKTKLIISQGLGIYRLGNRPEIVAVTLKSEK